MNGTLVIAAILAALVVLAGCAPKADSAAPTVTEEAVTNVGDEVSELEDLTADLGLDELDSLEQEITDIELLE